MIEKMWGIVLILAGSLAIIGGGRCCVMVTLYYLGRLRYLYFDHGQGWRRLMQCGSTFPLIGIGLLTGGVIRFAYIYFVPVIGGLAFLAAPLSLLISVSLAERFPPGWARRLEASRSPEELLRIHAAGRAALDNHPSIFKQIIRTDDGWDSWLTTIN